MSEADVVFAQETVLFASEEGDPVWSHRFVSDDGLAQLGDRFTVNSLVTPRSPRLTGLVAQEALAASGQWLANSLLQRSDGLLRPQPVNDSSRPRPGAAELAMAEAESLLGFSLAGLPQAYQDWRFAIECYFLLGSALYLPLDGFLLRFKALTERELGQAMGPRLLPFLDGHGHQPAGPMLFLVGCPARLSALGGLRGYRRTFLDAGRAAEELQCAAADAGAAWRFETEFFDDAAALVLSVDGVERVPLVIGYAYESSGSLKDGDVR